MEVGIQGDLLRVSLNPIKAISFFKSHPFYTCKVRFLIKQINLFKDIIKNRYPTELIELNINIQEGIIPEYNTDECKYNAAVFLKECENYCKLVSDYEEELMFLITSKIEKGLRIKRKK